MKVFIYGLFDPKNNELRYVGKAINLANRLKSHIDFAKDDISCPKSDWIKELLAQNLEPIISVLEETTEEGWAEAEIRWIADCRAKGLNLFNVADGGPNPPDWMGRKQSSYHVRKRVEARKANDSYGHSEETKQKISQKKKGTKLGFDNPFYGKHHTQETKEKIKKNNSWYKPTDEVRKKISEKIRQNPTRYWLGKKFSEETRQKLSKAAKGRKLSSEHVDKIRQRMLGTHLSEETKQKLREANLGKTHSEETKKKLGLLSKGRPKSEETKRKLSEANKGKERSLKQKIERARTQKEMWQDPAYRAKMLEAQKRRREREASEKALNNQK